MKIEILENQNPTKILLNQVKEILAVSFDQIDKNSYKIDNFDNIPYWKTLESKPKV